MYKLIIFYLVIFYYPTTVFAQIFEDKKVDKWADSRYSIEHNGKVVVDKITGLIWSKCILGLSGDNCKTGRAQVVTFYEAIVIAKKYKIEDLNVWRVPTKEELLTLLAFNKEQLKINSNIFPNTPKYWFWTITNDSGNSSRAFALNFSLGYQRLDNKYDRYYLRLVKTNKITNTSTEENKNSTLDDDPETKTRIKGQYWRERKE